MAPLFMKDTSLPVRVPAPCRLPEGWRSTLRSAGLDPRAVLTAAAIPAARLRAQRERLSIADYFRFWDALAAVSGNPLVGLALGAAADPAPREPLFIAMQASATAGEALSLVARYKRQLCPEALVAMPAAAGATRLCFRWPDRARPPQVLVDAEFAFLLSLIRRGTGQPKLTPAAVELRDRAPAEMSRRGAFFGCPQWHGAADDALVLTADFLATPFRRPDPALRSRLVAGFEATFATAADTTARVRALLAERIPCGRPSLASVARALALSVRALQRELAREGTSYRALVEDVRNATACGYLRDTAFSAEEVAFLVGFEDPASFYRSFRGWNGVSPARFRHGLRAMATPTVDSLGGPAQRRA